MFEWPRNRVAVLLDLVGNALPSEDVDHDDLLACCWDGLSRVFVHPNEFGVVAASVDLTQSGPVGVIELLVVQPGHQGRGLGRELLAAAERWLVDQGVEQLSIGRVGSLHLWPGIDVGFIPMLKLVESAGYVSEGIALVGTVPTTFRAETPDGFSIRRIIVDEDADAIRQYVVRRWPSQLAEIEMAICQGTCHVAFAGVEPVGYSCHSLNRIGWVGPLIVDQSQRNRGLGSGLLSASCHDLMIAGLTEVHLVPAGSLGFLSKVGGEVTRVFQRFTKPVVT